jgi:hypothetical protein
VDQEYNRFLIRLTHVIIILMKPSARFHRVIIWCVLTTRDHQREDQKCALEWRTQRGKGNRKKKRRVFRREIISYEEIKSQEKGKALRLPGAHFQRRRFLECEPYWGKIHISRKEPLQISWRTSEFCKEGKLTHCKLKIHSKWERKS